MRNCKELTKLASKACDEQISLGEKLELKLHLMMCKRCRDFANNNIILKDMIRAHRQYDQAK